MDISNSLVTNRPLRPLQEKAPANSGNGRDQANQAPQRESAPVVNASELIKRGSEIAQNRVQRLDATDSATFKARQALETYQQTEVFAQQFEQGELVGIDLFV